MPKLTDRFVSSLRVEPPRKDRLVFDTECPGLGVRTTARGTRSFIVQWTDPATKRKIREPIGVWGNISIEQARTAARARLGDVAKGIDPAAERARRKAAEIALREEQALTLDTLIDDWARLHLSARRPRYVAEAQRAIRLAFRDYLKRPAARLSRVEVIGVLDGIASADKAVTAGRTMAYGRAAFGWAVKRGKVPNNPFSGLPVSSGATERDRVLTDEEVRRVWDATKRLPYPFGPFYQIAILTLQRREEVAGMRWSEIDEGLTRWQIPSGRMKNGKPHDVHLPDAARKFSARCIAATASIWSLRPTVELRFQATRRGRRPSTPPSRATTKIAKRFPIGVFTTFAGRAFPSSPLSASIASWSTCFWRTNPLDCEALPPFISASIFGRFGDAR
jgi:integrase